MEVLEAPAFSALSQVMSRLAAAALKVHQGLQGELGEAVLGLYSPFAWSFVG